MRKAEYLVDCCKEDIEPAFMNEFCVFSAVYASRNSVAVSNRKETSMQLPKCEHCHENLLVNSGRKL